MDNVVIKFTEQGLEDIAEQLVNIGAIDAQQAAKFKQSNEEFKARQQLVSQMSKEQQKTNDELTKSVKSMEDFSKAAEKTTKNIVSGAINKAIEETGKAIDKNTESLKKENQQIKEMKAQLAEMIAYEKKLSEQKEKTAPGKQQSELNKKISETRFEIKQVSEEVKKLEAAEKAAVTPVVSLRKELKDLKAQMALVDGEEFDRLAKKAGEIQDKIADVNAATKEYASDTATFDAISAGIRGIGAGFQIAQGAQALFGQGSEDLQKQLVKIQATMALVNGLTEVQKLLQKESALRIGLTNAQRFIQNSLERVGITIQTQSNVAEGTGEAIKKRVVVVQAVENGLTAKSVVVRGAATAAQWLLNSAMLAFPLFAIITGLTVMVGLFSNVGKGLDDVAAKQNFLNEINKENMKILQAQDDYINKYSSDLVARYQRELDLLKAQKASTEEIRRIENLQQQERNRNANFQFGNHLIEIGNLEKNKLAVVGLTAALASYNKSKIIDDTDDYDKTIESLKEKLEIVKELVKQGEDAKINQLNATLERDILAAEQKKAIELEGLALQKDIISAKLRFAKEGGEQQLALQLALAENQRNTEVANLKSANQSRVDIEAAYQEKRMQLIEAYNTIQLQKKRSLIEAEIKQVRIGSQSEFDLKLKALEVENQIALNNYKLTDEKRRELTAVYLRNIRELSLDFAKKQRDDEINTQLLINSAKSTLAERHSEKELQLTQQKLALQEQLELNNIDRNIVGTELGEAKKAEIIARYAEKNKQVERDAIEYVIAERIEENNRISSVLQKRADIEANSVTTTWERKQEIRLQAFDSELTLLQKQETAITDRYIAGIITYDEYQKELTRIHDEEVTNRLAKAAEADRIEMEAFQRKSEQIARMGTETITLLNTMNDSYLQNKLDGYATELRNNEELYRDKTITEKQYAANKSAIERKIAKEKKEAAEKEKALALIQILINTASSIIKTAAEMGYPAAIPFQVLAAATGSAQFAAVETKQIPGYEKGTENAPRGWAWVGEKGPELIMMKGGEKVKTHQESVKMAKDYNVSLRNSYADKIDRSPIPSIAAERAMNLLKTQNNGIDIVSLSKMIGNEVGEQLSKLPITMMSFDKNGFQMSLHEGSSTTTYINSRYSSN